MNQQVKHLYIHIPFCNSICTYCDFVRFVPTSKKQTEEYVQKIIHQIKKECHDHQYETIYIGGGTPNSLSDNLLDLLLKVCAKKLANKFEFTIECNPEFINENQVKIFKKNKINRISLGVQTLNTKILKIFNRKHTNKDVINAVNLLHQNGIENISVDFIYGIKEANKKDYEECLEFLVKNNIKHVSFYALELKPGSILTKQGFHLDEIDVEKQLKIIERLMQKHNFIRYEIANFALNENYFSQHNLAYWNSNDWKAIGLGAYGLENQIYYSYVGNVDQYQKQNQKYTKKEYYQHILIMGLRLLTGFDLSIPVHNEAFSYFKHKLNPKTYEIKNNKVFIKNPNQLNEVLVNLLD